VRATAQLIQERPSLHKQGEQVFKPLPCSDGQDTKGSAAQQRPASAPRPAAGKREYSAAGRPTTPGGGRKIMNGDTWGTYNPMWVRACVSWTGCPGVKRPFSKNVPHSGNQGHGTACACSLVWGSPWWKAHTCCFEAIRRRLRACVRCLCAGSSKRAHKACMCCSFRSSSERGCAPRPSQGPPEAVPP